MTFPRILRRAGSAAALTAALALAPAARAQNGGPAEPGPVDRWVVTFSAGAFTLDSRARTEKILPASDELPAVQLPPSGFFYELRAADGSVRYRRIVADPVRLVFEGPAESPGGETPAGVHAGPARSGRTRTARDRDPGRDPLRAAASESPSAARSRAVSERATTATIVRDEVIPASRTFSLLTPHAEAGETLVLFGAPLEPGTEGEPSRELARFTVPADGPQ